MEDREVYTIYKEGLTKDKEIIYDADTDKPLTITVYNKSGKVVKVVNATDKQKSQVKEHFEGIKKFLSEVLKIKKEETTEKIAEPIQDDDLTYIDMDQKAKIVQKSKEDSYNNFLANLENVINLSENDVVSEREKSL